MSKRILSEIEEEAAYARDVAKKLAIAEGRRLATAAIVADLRAMAVLCSSAGEERISIYVDGLADRYERGEHEEGT
jgi:hypothetical protein